MTERGSFGDKEAIIAEVLQHYRKESHHLSGPTEAVTHLWPKVRRRIPRELLERLAQDAIAHEVSRRATNGMSLERGWQAADGMVSITYGLPNDPAQRGEPVKVRVQRQPYAGPQVVYPKILVETVYTTATGSKSLIWFTRADFEYRIEHFVDQRNGIDRHIGAMHHGITLLAEHQVTSMADLPHEVIIDFAKRWKETVRATKQEESTAA